MDHVAIMKKSWGLLPKIISGKKKIESRWYLSKRIPWDKVKKGDCIYFKNAGEKVGVKAVVRRVIQFEDLNPTKVKEILDKYGRLDGLEKENIPYFFELFKYKRYCILVFLQSPQRIKPFFINKRGFGAMSAWISVDNIEEIKFI